MCSWRSFIVALCWGLAICSCSARAGEAEVHVTPMQFNVSVADKLETVRANFLSALEDRNYTLVNELNVQVGLKNRGIDAPPVLLIEFINLSKAYQITKSNRAFELFAPLRAALFQEKNGETTIMMMRPNFIKNSLSGDGLSPTATATLDEFERDMQAVLKVVANGGF